MKILLLTPYVTLLNRREFCRNQTGFGYMVMDIAKAVGKLEHVDVLATDSRGEPFEQDRVRFLKRSMWDYLKDMFYCLPLASLINLRKCYEMTNGTFIRLMYYWLMTGYLKKELVSEKYDIVHIQSCSFGIELWIQICKSLQQKYIVTLHGLDSFSETVRLESAGKKFERDFLKRVSEGEIPITVISTGMKKLIEKTYNTPDCNNITVICNSFSFLHNETSISIREQYAIPKESKVLLYVGNISKNKNQVQLVRAYGLLPDDLRKQTFLLFCGEDHAKDGDVEKAIKQAPNENHIILCGGIDKANMPDYYSQADGVVLLSYAEGFGLSLIEGMHFGLPCVMHKDLDAFVDIYNKCAVVPAEGRDDNNVANAIVKLLTNDWNKESIKAYSKKFESESMAQQYIDAYKQIARV